MNGWHEETFTGTVRPCLGYALRVTNTCVGALALVEISFVGQGGKTQAASVFNADELDSIILAFRAARKLLPNPRPI